MVDPSTHFLLEHADEELRRLRLALPHLLTDLERRLLATHTGPAFPLLHFGQKHKVARLAADQVGAMEDWFFIGDLHGDFFALHTLLRQAQTLNPDCRILFLGDMVDRGPMPIECIFLLLEWGIRHPGRLAWIAGNHDIAFIRKDQGEFVSIVSPAELLTELNAQDLFAGTRQRLGQFFIEMASRLPRALLFPDGLLATHGGFPLIDQHAQGQAAPDEAAYLEWLNTEACLKDFTWTRINRAPKKMPDRYSSGSQYGFTDFEAFCRLQPQWFPVDRLLTGHEHPAAGFDLHPTYKINRALTLVGLGFNDYQPLAIEKYTPTLHLGRGVTGGVPEVIAVPVDRDQLAMLLHGKPMPVVTPPVTPPPLSSAPAPTVIATPMLAQPPSPFLPPVPPKD